MHRTATQNPQNFRAHDGIDALVASAQTDAQKVELYTASRLAIEPETRAERGYLDMLAGRLKLPDPLVDHVEATVSAAKV